MLEQYNISIIVPFYNSESHIKKCLDSLIVQDFSLSFEIIMVDDGSSDRSEDLIKTYKYPYIKLFSLSSNSGPAVARNLGLKKAEGDYIFFLDVDDTIETNTLSVLYKAAIETNSDLVFSDSKWVENNQNQRENFYSYPEDMDISGKELTKIMQDRLYNSQHMGGPLSCKARLIKRSLVVDNNVQFEERLRYLEDEIFMWNILAFVNRAKYIRKQLYTYYVYPNVNTAVVASLNRGFSVSKFKIIKNHIQQSFAHRGCSRKEVNRLGDQAFVYFIINVLVSYSKSMLQGKVQLEKGIICRRQIIDNVLDDMEVAQAVKNYSPSENESLWILRAITWKFPKLLEFTCTNRAKKILKLRRNQK